MNKIFTILKKKFPAIRKDIPLKNHTTFKIGGPARYFLVVKDKKNLAKVLFFAKKLNLPVFVFGGGSNLLISEKGFSGFVVKIQNAGGIFLKPGNVIEAFAGVPIKNMVSFAARNSLSGLEWAGGLPGTIGGAVRGNAGAFGGEIKDSVVKVEALDENLNLKKLNNKQCEFSYRNSVFKQKNWIILSVSVKLKKGDKKTIAKIVFSNIKYRKDRHPIDFPSAGSIFKNVPLSGFSPQFQEKLAAVVKKDPFPIVPAAYLISETELKGVKMGGAQISQKHPNFIVNLNGAKSEDILGLINIVKKEVKKKFGVNMETEVQLVGF